MTTSILNVALIAAAALSLAACSTSSERIGGAGVGIVSGAAVAGPVGAVVGGVVGVVEGPTVATDVGVPHHRRHRHWRRPHHRWRS